MRIVCPSCAAQYEVPASRMTQRRMVRCARCGGQWKPVQEAEPPRPADEAPASLREDKPLPVAQPDVLPPVTAMDRLAVGAPKPVRPVGLRVAWIMTIVILAAAVAGAVIWRAPITRTWPPASRILGSSEPEAVAATPGSGPSAATQPEAHHPTKE